MAVLGVAPLDAEGPGVAAPGAAAGVAATAGGSVVRAAVSAAVGAAPSSAAAADAAACVAAGGGAVAGRAVAMAAPASNKHQGFSDGKVTNTRVAGIPGGNIVTCDCLMPKLPPIELPKPRPDVHYCN